MPSGNVYVADDWGNRIRMLDQAGNVSTIAGDGNGGEADGPVATAELSGPHRHRGGFLRKPVRRRRRDPSADQGDPQVAERGDGLGAAPPQSALLPTSPASC